MSLSLNECADYLILINPDTCTPSNLITDLITFLEENPAYGVVGPMQAAYTSGGNEKPLPNDWTRHAIENGERHAFYHWVPSLPSEAGGRNRRASNTLEHAYVQGAAFAIRATVARRVGLFDVTYYAFYEEVDLCRRVRWAGFRVALLSKLWIEHAGGSVTEKTPSRIRSFHMTRNRLLYLFTDPLIGLPTIGKLTAMWIKDDVTAQLPSDQGLVVNLAQYVRIWYSLFCLFPYIVRTRARNKRLIRENQGILSANSDCSS